MGTMSSDMRRLVTLTAYLSTLVSACQLPDLGPEFTIKGGTNSFFFGDGKYNFTIGENGEGGYVLEDVWLSNHVDDKGLTTNNRETLVWFGPDGKKLATFQRVAQAQTWFSWLTSGATGEEPAGYKDFSQGILVEGCADSGALYFVGYEDHEDNYLMGLWSHRTPGHYRVYSFGDVGETEMTLAVTNETGTKVGGGSKYPLEAFASPTTCHPASHSWGVRTSAMPTISQLQT